MKRIVKYIMHPKMMIIYLLKKIAFLYSDEKYLKIAFKLKIGRTLNLENPQSYNEKLQWLKLNDRNQEYTKMVDKYIVKNYVGHIIGNEYIIPTIGVWDNVDSIDWDTLPEAFVLKVTHDSGGIVICNNKKKMDEKAAKNKLRKALKRNFYYISREWPYKNVKRRIIAEKYIVDENENELKDYKFFCFNGRVKFFKIDFDRFTVHHANYYAINCELLPFGETICPPDFEKKIKIPNNINEMIVIAEKLSKNHLFLRVDLYNVNNRILFGELTFYPASGFGKFYPEEWDYTLGSWLILPPVKK